MLKLSDVLGSGVPLEWYESVALVRGVVDRQLEGSEERPLIPALDQVQLTADGQVTLLGGHVVDEPVRRMGQILQAILSHSDPPVQLRLVASQATAPTPAYSSLREYSEALLFFERPGRSAILQALYARAALAVSNSSAPGPAPTLDEMAPLPSKKKQLDPVRQIAVATSRRRKALVAVSVVALLLGCAAAAKYARTPSGVSRLKMLTARTVQASDGIGGTVVSAVSTVTDRVGLGRLVPAGTSGASTPIAPALKKAEPAQKRHQEQKRPPVNHSQLQPKPLVGFDLDLPPTPAVVPAVSASVAPSSGPAIASAAPPSKRPIAVAGHSSDSTIYSPDSRGVSAPVGVKPQLPRRLPAELDPNGLGRIELIVSSDGTVESVKLLKAPRNVHDSMFLSAAKAWQFQPALKDGFPVRYRKTVWIAPQ
jgi:hypothetical protein